MNRQLDYTGETAYLGEMSKPTRPSSFDGSVYSNIAERNGSIIDEPRLRDRIVVENHGDYSFSVSDRNHQELYISTHIIPFGKRYLIRFNHHSIFDLNQLAKLVSVDATSDANGIVIKFEDSSTMTIQHCSLEMFAIVLENIGPTLQKYQDGLQKEVQGIYDSYFPLSHPPFSNLPHHPLSHSLPQQRPPPDWYYPRIHHRYPPQHSQHPPQHLQQHPTPLQQSSPWRQARPQSIPMVERSTAMSDGGNGGNDGNAGNTGKMVTNGSDITDMTGGTNGSGQKSRKKKDPLWKLGKTKG